MIVKFYFTFTFILLFQRCSSAVKKKKVYSKMLDLATFGTPSQHSPHCRVVNSGEELFKRKQMHERYEGLSSINLNADKGFHLPRKVKKAFET